MLSELTAHEALDGLIAGDLTSVELTRSVLDRIDVTEPQINAYISVDADGALDAAARHPDTESVGVVIPPIGAL